MKSSSSIIHHPSSETDNFQTNRTTITATLIMTNEIKRAEGEASLTKFDPETQTMTQITNKKLYNEEPEMKTSHISQNIESTYDTTFSYSSYSSMARTIKRVSK
ncbi:hypothetical protein FIE12Z_8449 [Fusarium flagelliforme]|uniref:Uncharacterized protein n=1 Tax=Fusarium flagelliforme TaxID=2675880 RepID=A0A395MHK7_9HYPO|nr:hypothetical protein FIE12Z_8449 [Fusarium flagelliforme]